MDGYKERDGHFTVLFLVTDDDIVSRCTVSQANTETNNLPSVLFFKISIQFHSLILRIQHHRHKKRQG